MPELPEVETVRRGLEAALKGSVIRKVTLRREGLRIPFPRNLANSLEGCAIKAVKRRAKYLLFKLDNEEVLISHLGMTGRFSLERRRPARLKAHDHVIIEFTDGRALIYNDVRRFGLMILCKRNRLLSHHLFAQLGPEPLGPDFSADYLESVLENRQSPIKPVLMDKSVVVGVGNIYANEALFLAGIDPCRPASEVAHKAKKLVASIRKVLRSALASGGSSLKDFQHVSGDSGYFQHHFNVYGRKGKPCVTCKRPIKAIRLSGRSTFYCSHCQK